jgi:DNA-binding response OmpR family regulator
MSDDFSKKPFRDRSITRKVKDIKLKKLSEQKVVNLSDYRELNKSENVKTILVVDDEDVMCNAMYRMLSKDGYRVLTAQDGTEFSKIIESTRLDLILLDVNMPWVNGYEICKLVKGHPKHRDVPLFFVSARDTDDDIEKGYAAGCDEYITKPFDVDFILGVVRKTFLKSS